MLSNILALYFYFLNEIHWRFRGLDFVLHVFLHTIFEDEEKVLFYLVKSCSFLMLYFYNDAHRPPGVTVATVARQQSIDIFFFLTFGNNTYFTLFFYLAFCKRMINK